MDCCGRERLCRAAPEVSTCRSGWGNTGYVTGRVGRPCRRLRQGPSRPPGRPRGFNSAYGLIKPFTYRMSASDVLREQIEGRPSAACSGSARLYQTDVLRQKAVEFIRRHAAGCPPRSSCSVTFFTPTTSPATPAHDRPPGENTQRHVRSCASYPSEEPPDYNEDNMSDEASLRGRCNRRITPMREATIVTRCASAGSRCSRWTRQWPTSRGAQAIRRARRDLCDLSRPTTATCRASTGTRKARCCRTTLDPGAAVDARAPDTAGRRTKALVGNIDLAPTILKATSARSRGASTVARSCPSPATSACEASGRCCMRRSATGHAGASATCARAGPADSRPASPPGGPCAPRAGCTWTTRAERASCTTSSAIRPSCARLQLTRGCVCACARCGGSSATSRAAEVVHVSAGRPPPCASGRSADWLRTRTRTATMNRPSPAGPRGGGWAEISTPEKPSRIATASGAPAWR